MGNSANHFVNIQDFPYKGNFYQKTFPYKGNFCTKIFPYKGKLLSL